MTLRSRAFLYGRHSTKHQSQTQEQQKWTTYNYFNHYLRPKGVELVDFFYDAAISGGSEFGERPMGRVVLTSLQPNDWFVFADWSRTFRDLEDSERVMKMLQSRRVNVHCTSYPIDGARAVGRYTRRIIVAGNQLERELASERVLERNHYKMSRGEVFSRGVPMGWRKSGRVVDGRRIVEYRVDKDERLLCDYVANLRSNGKSHERIAQWLHIQRVFKSKRGSDRTTVVWMLQARACVPPYPKITSYKRMRKMVKSGQLRLSPS